MKTYLTTLIKEKGLDTEDTIKSLQEQGHIGLTYGVLIDFVCQQPQRVQDKVKNTLVQLDFANGNISNYLDFLAKGMVHSWGY